MFKFILHVYRMIFAHKIFRKFNLAIFHLGLRGLGIINYENERVSGETYLISKILPRVIKNDTPVFFDVGANIGAYTIALLEKFPRACIYSFEPHPKSFSHLATRVPSNRVICQNIALGEKPERTTLYNLKEDKDSICASLYEEVISRIYGFEAIKYDVDVESLDNFSERKKIDFVDFIKIDAEGSEFSILKGASKLLEDKRIGCIQFEFNSMNIISRVFLRDFKKLLHGYTFYRMLPSGFLPIDDVPVETEIFGYQNIFALSKMQL